LRRTMQNGDENMQLQVAKDVTRELPALLRKRWFGR